MSDVSRSVYQKVCEENKRLKADIEVLVDRNHDEKFFKVLLRWRRKFYEDKEFENLLKAAAIKYLGDHP